MSYVDSLTLNHVPAVHPPADPYSAQTAQMGINSFGDLTNLGAYGFVLGVLLVILFTAAVFFLRTYSKREGVFMKLLFEERAENTALVKSVTEAVTNSTLVTTQQIETLNALRQNLTLENQSIIAQIKDTETNIKDHVTRTVNAR